jgi:hypothetical protein
MTSLYSELTLFVQIYLELKQNESELTLFVQIYLELKQNESELTRTLC